MWLPLICIKKHIETGKVYRCVFLLSIFYLLKNTINIIKANTIIVSTTNANKSKYIISNKIASIIAPPPHSQMKVKY